MQVVLRPRLIERLNEGLHGKPTLISAPAGFGKTTLVKGHVGCQWTDWFDGLSIALGEGDDTLLTGPVVDQAALYGLLWCFNQPA